MWKDYLASFRGWEMAEAWEPVSLFSPTFFPSWKYGVAVNNLLTHVEDRLNYNFYIFPSAVNYFSFVQPASKRILNLDVLEAIQPRGKIILTNSDFFWSKSKEWLLKH